MKNNRGFTLLEILLSLALLSIVLMAVYGTFFLAHRAIEGNNRSLLKLQEGRTTLDKMRRELESLLYDSNKKNTFFILEDRDVYGKQTSRIRFTAFAPLTPGLASISYYVREDNNKLSLYKEIRSANRQQAENTEPVELAEDIGSFTVEALGADGKWIRTWDASLFGKAPSELRIRLAMPVKDKTILLSETAAPRIR